MYNNNVKMSRTSYTAPREIKASAHYSYIPVGITLDGSKFSVGELILEGQCLVKDDTTGKYEKYVETTPGTFPTGKSDPVILDESIKIPVDDSGVNVDVTAGQVIVHGSVLTGMLIGVTTQFKAKLNGAIQFR